MKNAQLKILMYILAEVVKTHINYIYVMQTYRVLFGFKIGHLRTDEG